MIFPIQFPSSLSLPRDTCQMYVSGTDTFRRGHRALMSSDLDSDYSNFGGNRANLSKDVRCIWKASKGYKFCNVDQSGAEALIVAHLCRDGKYRSLFKNGLKPHAYLALKLFREQWHEYFDKDQIELACKTPIEQLKHLPFWSDLVTLIMDSDNWENGKRYYHFAKKTVHARSYRMQASTFILQMLKESEGDIVLPLSEGKRLLNGFDQEFPEITEWHFRVLSRLKKTKQLRNMFNHPYNVTSYIPDDIEKIKDFIAWIPQSSVAEITRTAFVNLYNYIKSTPKPTWHPAQLDNHDSYLAESPENEILELAKMMKQFIEIEFTSPFDGSKFRMKSGVSVGYNFGPRKEKRDKDGNIIEIINPEGLQEIKLVC